MKLVNAATDPVPNAAVLKVVPGVAAGCVAWQLLHDLSIGMPAMASIGTGIATKIATEAPPHDEDELPF